MAINLLNILPSSILSLQTPFGHLFNVAPTYHHLRVFGCLCLPNLSTTSPHKLAPRSTPCIFLGYPSDHRGYRCLDLTTNIVITSRYVTFDESTFPFSCLSSSSFPAPNQPTSSDESFPPLPHPVTQAPATPPGFLPNPTPSSLPVPCNSTISSFGYIANSSSPFYGASSWSSPFQLLIPHPLSAHPVTLIL